MMRWSVHTVGECGALVCTMMRYSGFLRLIALEGRGDVTEDINKPIRCNYVVQGYMMGVMWYKTINLLGVDCCSGCLCGAVCGDDTVFLW